MLDAYAVAFIGTLGSAAIRLGVIGQSDAQRVVAALMDRILAASAFAQVSTLDDLGAATWRSDLASLQHETQHTRLFRS
jgi:urease accessory protein